MLEALEHEARINGGSLIDVRDDMHRIYVTGQPHPEKPAEPPSKAREQRRAQQELMAAMGMGARARA